MSWSLFLTSLSLLSLSCFWCRFSVRHMGHKAGFHLCLEGSTRGAKRKVAEIFRTWKSFVCLRDADKCPPKITRDPCTDSSSLKGFSWHLRGCLFDCLFSFYLLLMEYDCRCMPKVKVKAAQYCLLETLQFSRPERWSGQPFPSPRDLPNPGIELRSLALQVDSLPSEPQGKP